MKRVYIAGPYSGNTMQTLNNMRAGIRAATEVLLAGFAPFAPWLDYQLQLMLRDGETLTVEDYYTYSLAWLEVSDAILMVPGWGKSRGARQELKHALKLNIPSFFSLSELVQAFYPENPGKESAH